MATLASVGELAFIDAIARLVNARAPRRGVRVGIGDDAAVVVASRATLVTTDSLIEDVHFRRGWLGPRDVGRRAFRIAVSDIAAMGGIPRYALLSLALPPATEAAYARGIVGGLVDDAAACGTALVGGNVSRSDKISIVVTIIADAIGRPILRAGARAGDPIWLTGPVGAAAAGIELLESGATAGSLVAAYRRPPLRLDVAAALARRRVVSAMIDVSDGVVHDLRHVCEASGVTASLDVEALPMTAVLRRAAGMLVRPIADYALYGGDDYELLLTTRPRADVTEIAALCQARGGMLSRVGVITRRGDTHLVVDARGHPLESRGYEHFRSKK